MHGSVMTFSRTFWLSAVMLSDGWGCYRWARNERAINR